MKQLTIQIIPILLVWALFACTADVPTSGGLASLGSMDNSNRQFPITVFTYGSVSELNAAIKDKKSSKNKVRGFSRWWFASKEKKEMLRCEIHVVTPRIKDGTHVMTWGHELAHCVYGSYHPEAK